MKTTFILAAVFVIVVARPQNSRHAHITRYDSNVGNPEGYQFAVATSDGFRHEQTGQIINPRSKNAILTVKGFYSYIGPDGVTYTVIYTADDNGFQPAGEHLPPSAGVKKLGIPSAAQASLIGGGLG